MSAFLRGLGYVEDEPSTADHMAAVRLRTLPTPPPRARNADLVKIVNQVELGACTAFSAGQAVRAAELLVFVDRERDEWVASGKSLESFDANYALLKAQHETEFWSFLMAYYLARAFAGETSLDAGAQIRNIFRGINQYGYAPESSWTYDSNTRRGAKFTKMPPAAVFRLAYDQRDNKANRDANLLDYERIASTGSQRRKDIETAVASRHLVVFGMRVTRAFGQDGTANKGAPIPRPKNKNDVIGGHAMPIAGINPNGAEVANSWGTDFGGGGEDGLPPGWCQFSWEYIEDPDWVSDLWIVRRAPLMPKADA